MQGRGAAGAEDLEGWRLEVWGSGFARFRVWGLEAEERAMLIFDGSGLRDYSD